MHGDNKQSIAARWKWVILHKVTINGCCTLQAWEGVDMCLLPSTNDIAVKYSPKHSSNP
jgi:hypothetical protein